MTISSSASFVRPDNGRFVELLCGPWLTDTAVRGNPSTPPMVRSVNRGLAPAANCSRRVATIATLLASATTTQGVPSRTAFSMTREQSRR